MTPTGPRIMSGRLASAALFFMATALAACGEKPRQPAPQATPDKLFQQERETLDKAKGVEQAVTKGAEDLRQEEEKQAQ